MPDMPDTSLAAFRQMRTADISFADELRSLAGWNQTTTDWAGYLALEAEGCFIADVEGNPAGTVTTICYGKRFGWIGMVLVHPAYRRRGLGTELIRRAIAHLKSQDVGCIKLDATPMGKTVYLPMGFGDEYELTRYEGLAPSLSGAAPASVSALSEDLFLEVARFDAPFFGSDRLAVLESMGRRNPELCFVARSEGKISGYLIAREGHAAVQLGPWVARDAATAEELLEAFFRRVPGRRVFLDVPHPNREGVVMAGKYGFKRQRDFTRMYSGDNFYPGDPRCIFGTSGGEKG